MRATPMNVLTLQRAVICGVKNVKKERKKNANNTRAQTPYFRSIIINHADALFLVSLVVTLPIGTFDYTCRLWPLNPGKRVAEARARSE